MSDATLMGDELLKLCQGTIPGTREWKTEIYLGRGSLPASRNKFLACNAAELMFCWLRNDRARVREILDWWVWFASTRFTEGEDLTPEEVYRSLMAYSSLTAYAVALKVQHADAIIAAGNLAQAHAAWLLLGVGCGSARKVRDHKLGEVGKPVVIVGDGPPVSALPYVAQAGKRGWIRNRHGGEPFFLFAESVGLSVIVGQACGLTVPRKLAPWQVDMLAALERFFPGLPPFGFTLAMRESAHLFLADPRRVDRARLVVEWIGGQVPSLPFLFVRYEDGSVVSMCERATGSSTDARMVDAWYADGRSMKTSADDGLRSESPSQIGFELGESFACQLASGGPSISIPRPQSAEVYRVRCADGRVTLTVPGQRPPSSPETPVPVPPAKPRRRRWWEFWK